LTKASRTRFIQTGAASGILAATGVPALAAPPPETDMSRYYDAAKKEGSLTWWTAHFALDDAQAVANAFMAKYPGVQVNFIRQTAQVIYQRLQQNLKSGINDVDVFASTDEAHYVTLKKANALAVYVPGNYDKIPPLFRNIDPDGTYHTAIMTFIVINYNDQKITPAPRRWPQLNDPKYRGQITVGHPGFSGYVGNWVVAMNELYGWEYFKSLKDQDPKINRSIFDVVTDILSGERQLGASTDGFALQKRAGGGAINIAYPEDDTVLAIGPMAVMKNAPHPAAARLFATFTYSKEFSDLLAKRHLYPLRYDVAPANGLTYNKFKWTRMSVDKLLTGVPEVIAKWRETFGV